ncbi:MULTISPECIES: alpha/beta hydrolase fold domain-containing protein [unclassified Microbacterium]|uniref:alpha/beta hydrolase fold domain-containing protein n=1 Tax=unclassified Microbacterium TaxID=2609290 RepID=UPI0015E37263|nr:MULTISPECIES: alpha/beta hydrolase [unclassified Microbacterium]
MDQTIFDSWPVYTLTPAAVRGGHVLFLHGGAFAAEIQHAHWSFAARLAERTGRIVTVPIYPLVPNATHLDVQPVLRRLFSTLARSDGTAVVGDSAGAALAVGLVAGLTQDDPRPDRVVLLSPLIDLTLTNPRIDQVAPRDPLLRADHLRELSQLYAGELGLSAPQVNPIDAPLNDLGPVEVFTGTRDLLNPDAHLFHDRANSETGTVVTVHEYPDLVHDWMLLPIPEAEDVLRTLTELLTRTPS